MMLGIDYGKKNVGIAISDEKESFAMKLDILNNSESLIEELLDIAKKYNIAKIVIGYPRLADGNLSEMCKEIDGFITKFQEENPVEFIKHDETLSSKQAEENLKKRKKIDGEAARIILQEYLDLHN